MVEGTLRALAARLAATNATPVQLARIERLLDEGDARWRLADLAAGGDAAGHGRPGAAARRSPGASTSQLNEAWNNPVLLRLLRAWSTPSASPSASASSRASCAQGETSTRHDAGATTSTGRSYDAVRAGDGDEAERLMRAHAAADAWRRRHRARPGLTRPPGHVDAHEVDPGHQLLWQTPRGGRREDTTADQGRRWSPWPALLAGVRRAASARSRRRRRHHRRPPPPAPTAPSPSTSRRPSRPAGTRAGSSSTATPAPDQWEPVLEAFDAEYPWIEVETFDLGGTEAFQRYLSEEATGGSHRRRHRQHRRRRLARPGRAGPGRRLRRPRAGRPARHRRAGPGRVRHVGRPARSACSTPRPCPLDEQPDDAGRAGRHGRGPRRPDRHHRGRERPGRAGHLRLRRRQGRGGWEVLEAIGPARRGRGQHRRAARQAHQRRVRGQLHGVGLAPGADRHDRDRRRPQLPLLHRRHASCPPGAWRVDRGGRVAELGPGAHQLPALRGGPDRHVRRRLHARTARASTARRAWPPSRRRSARRTRSSSATPRTCPTEQEEIRARWNEAFGR